MLNIPGYDEWLTSAGFRLVHERNLSFCITLTLSASLRIHTERFLAVPRSLPSETTHASTVLRLIFGLTTNICLKLFSKEQLLFVFIVCLPRRISDPIEQIIRPHCLKNNAQWQATLVS